MKSFKQFLFEAKKKKKEKLFKEIRKSVKKQGDSPVVRIDIGSKPNSKERKAEIEYMMKHHGVRALKRQLANNQTANQE
jgi:hypothetical protein